MSTNAYDYWPVYELIQIIDEHAQGPVEIEKTARHRLVITKAKDNFPLALHILSPDEKKEELQVTEESFGRCSDAWKFYMRLRCQPYDPVCLEYHEALVKANDDLGNIEPRIEKVLQQYNYACGYNEVCLVTFWAYTYIYAYPNLFYVYQTDSLQDLMGDEPIGVLRISNYPSNQIKYSLAGEKTARILFYRYGVFELRARLYQRYVPPLGSSKNPVRNFKGLIPVMRDLSWEDQPQKIATCFLGEIEQGKPVAAQPYRDPKVPWWTIAYDMGYLGFFAAEVGMNLHMAIYALMGVADGVAFLEENFQKFLTSCADKLTEQRKSTAPSFGLFNLNLEKSLL